MLAKPLVTEGMLALELIVGRRPWPAEDNYPVLDPVPLVESPVTLGLDEFVRVDVLSCRLAAGHEEDVVTHQGERVEQTNDSVNHHGERDPEVAHSFAEQYSFPGPIDQDLGKTGPDEIGGEKRRCANKGEEVSVVSASNAVVKPHAMMVLRLNAIIAEPAVVGTRRSPDVAGAAMPNRDFHGGRRLVCRSNEVPVGRRRTYSEWIVVFGRWESVKISWENLANYLSKHEHSYENIREKNIPRGQSRMRE